MTIYKGAPKRTKASFKGAAIDYIEAQLEVMREYGSEPILTPDKYYRLVDEIQRVGERLWLDAGGEIQ